MKYLKVFVTGGTGFIGSHIIECLEKEYTPADIGLLVRRKEKVKDLISKGMTIYEGDITNLDNLFKILNDFNPQFIIHAAAIADDWAPLSELMKVNAEGTSNIIEVMIKSQSGNHLIHISSSGVYPRIEGVYISEEMRYGPQGNYHKSKVAAEKYIKQALLAKKIRATILRPPNVMGPRDTTQMAKIVNAIQNNKFPLIRKGRALQTWVNVEDLAHAIILIIKNPDVANGQIYNLKSFEISVKELYDQIVTSLNIKSSPKEYPYKLAYSIGYLSEILSKITKKKSTLNRYRIIKFGKDRLFDDSKIRNELGYSPRISAEESIKRTLEWMAQMDLL